MLTYASMYGVRSKCRKVRLEKLSAALLFDASGSV